MTMVMALERPHQKRKRRPVPGTARVTPRQCTKLCRHVRSSTSLPRRINNECRRTFWYRGTK